MRFNKKNKQGLFLLFLFLSITTSISFITIKPENKIPDNSSVLLSAPEDPYEYNDIPENATDIRFLEAQWLSSYLGNGSQWNDDWYMIDLDMNEERLRVELLFDHSAGNINIEVYDWNFNYMGGNNSMDDNEYFERDIFPNGIYYLRVFGDNTGNSYNLWWEDLMPYDDYMEENDDFWSSSWVESRYYHRLKIVDSDEDWFNLYLNSGETIDVNIYFKHLDGNLQLELYDPSYISRTYDNSSDDNAFISFTSNMDGDWRIRVYHADANSSVYYDLDLITGDDWMEQNDDYWNGYWISPNFYDNLVILGGDEDWFNIDLNSGDTIDISILFNHIAGDLQLELYDPNDNTNPRSTSTSTDNDEFIYFKADTPGTWRIRVYHAGANTNLHYDMDIWMYKGDEWSEPNEYNSHPGDIYDLSDDEGKWLSEIHGLAILRDDDWYMIEIYPGFQHLMVNLTCELSSQGSININLFRYRDEYGLDGNPVYSNHSITGDNKAVINCPYIDWGIYLIQVYGNSFEMEYDLWWDDFRTDNRPDDNYEENDNLSNAYDLSRHENEELLFINDTAIFRDNDWYRIQVQSGREQLIVLVKFDYQEGALGIEIYNSEGSQVISNFTNEDNEIINYRVPSNGTYFIRIFGDTDAGNIYSLSWHTMDPKEEMIPGYDIFILLGVIMGVGVVITLKWNKSKKTQ
ncbi:MAG: PPC domain-containing protein [Promethearchaeota archaeon]